MKLKWRDVPACLSVLISVTHNIHLHSLAAFCKHYFIKAVQRYWELDQEAQKDLLLYWSHAEMTWSEAPFISLSAGCRSIETLRCYQPHRRVVYLLVQLYHLGWMTLWLAMIKYTHPSWCRVHVRARVLIKRPHISEHGSVFRFIGAPRALEAYISSYQKTLITPSMSEQIHVHTSIHKASLTHSMCPPSPVFLSFYYSQECGCMYGTHSDTRIRTSFTLHCTWWHKQVSFLQKSTHS